MGYDDGYVVGGSGMTGSTLLYSVVGSELFVGRAVMCIYCHSECSGSRGSADSKIDKDILLILILSQALTILTKCAKRRRLRNRRRFHF